MGVLPQKIKRLQQQLIDLEQQPFSEETEEALMSIRSNLQSAMKQEEELWKAKSRIQWLTTTDLNIRFFHLSTVIRRRRNDINLLQDGSGHWFSERTEIGNLFLNHFKALYTSTAPLMHPEMAELMHPVSTDFENRFLCKRPDEREIADVVK